ncbi:MAG: HAMP domain-containing sensor histidine kinase, partial [Myxococcota bacterium]
KMGILNHDIKSPAMQLVSKGQALQNHLPEMIEAHKKLSLMDPAFKKKDRRVYERLSAIGAGLCDLSQDIYDFSETLLREMADPTQLFSKKQVVSLREVFQRACLYGLTPEQRERVKWTGETLLVHANPLFLMHAIVNLVRNALQHSPPGTIVTVFAKIIDGEPTLAVRNPGKGIPVKQQLNLFKPFVTYTEGGTGAGLGFVHTFMTQSGGRVYVVSTVGTGACFCCAFPKVPAKEMAKYEEEQKQKEEAA